ncbi:hypothetical protein BpHYR1_007022 [Brachionus plicatilis]|uniref:Uncharacterized protein n=1 Tax=Brachionus plicatilis TaxID=10195 RepID=A0A3M7PM57_BRAPC|nr:hypothetical protein BpHYR1_007022 [Brachionus plicatilis]
MSRQQMASESKSYTKRMTNKLAAKENQKKLEVLRKFGKSPSPFESSKTELKIIFFRKSLDPIGERKT